MTSILYSVYCLREGSMRYLLLAGFLAGCASASPIPLSELNLVVNGTNLQYAAAGGGIDSERGPSIGATLSAGHGAVSVSITLLSYLTVGGATGTGTMNFVDTYRSCDGTPFAIIYACHGTVSMASSFTFGVPFEIFEQYNISIFDAPLGLAQGGISLPFIANIRDSLGNPVNATLTYSASATPLAIVDNPEPATWGLLTFALGAMVATAVRRSHRVCVTST